MSLDQLLLPPNQEQKKVIEEAIGEDADRFENNLRVLEEWSQRHQNLPKNIEKNLLAVYLRGAKHDMQKVKRKLELYFICKRKIPDLLQVTPFTCDEMEIVKNIVIQPLPQLTDEGYRVTIMKLKDPSLELFDMVLASRLLWKFGNLRTCRERMIAGDVFVMDGCNFKANHIPKFISPQLKKDLFMAREMFCNRIRAIYVINAPSYVDNLVNLVKSLISEKLGRRISVDRGSQSIGKLIPARCLPADYGGHEKTVDELHELWDRCLDDHEKWFEAWNEAAWIGPIPKTMDDRCDFDESMGVQGTFRQLKID